MAVNRRNLTPIATGVVSSLYAAGQRRSSLEVNLDGIPELPYSGFTRTIEHHDGIHKKRGIPSDAEVANDRMLTLISKEEMAALAATLRITEIPVGCLNENVCVEGVSGFSRLLKPGSHIYFRMPDREVTCVLNPQQWNSPCGGVGDNLQQTYLDANDLSKRFVREAAVLRGVLGNVFMAGRITTGQIVEVYEPIQLA